MVGAEAGWVFAAGERHGWRAQSKLTGLCHGGKKKKDIACLL